MVLHLVNQSSSPQPLELCLRFAVAGDTLLLIEDGVHYAVAGSTAHRQLAAPSDLHIAVLADDLAARGLLNKAAPNIQPISYDRFVALCCEANTVQSWF